MVRPALAYARPEQDELTRGGGGEVPRAASTSVRVWSDAQITLLEACVEG